MKQCLIRAEKCNRGRPICANCIKSGLDDQCGYRNLIEISFRNESSQTAQKAKRTWKTRTKMNESTHKSDENSLSQRSITSTLILTHKDQSLMPLRTALSCDVTDCALNRF